jgi:hypothetical protein
VIATASSDGLGFHCLLNIGGWLHRKMDQKKVIAEIFQNRKILVLSPNCSSCDLYTRYPSQVIIRNDWREILENLKEGNSSQRVAIFPNGSLQFTLPL